MRFVQKSGNSFNPAFKIWSLDCIHHVHFAVIGVIKRSNRKGEVERISTFLNKAHQGIQLCQVIPKKYKQKYLCSFNDDFDITVETAENHLMLLTAHLGHNLGHRQCTTLCQWAWQFVGSIASSQSTRA